MLRVVGLIALFIWVFETNAHRSAAQPLAGTAAGTGVTFKTGTVTEKFAGVIQNELTKPGSAVQAATIRAALDIDKLQVQETVAPAGGEPGRYSLEVPPLPAADQTAVNDAVNALRELAVNALGQAQGNDRPFIDAAVDKKVIDGLVINVRSSNTTAQTPLQTALPPNPPIEKAAEIENVLRLELQKPANVDLISQLRSVVDVSKVQVEAIAPPAAGAPGRFRVAFPVIDSATESPAELQARFGTELRRILANALGQAVPRPFPDDRFEKAVIAETSFDFRLNPAVPRMPQWYLATLQSGAPSPSACGSLKLNEVTTLAREYQSNPLLQALTNHDSGAAAALYARGYHLFWAQDMTAAAECFTAVVNATPYDLRAWYYKGLAETRLGWYSKAAASYAVAIAIDASRNGDTFDFGSDFRRFQGSERQQFQTMRLMGLVAIRTTPISR